MIIQCCQEDLIELRQLVDLISVDTYCFKAPLLANATIGQHVRHVLEFYDCVLNDAGETVVNYDRRMRAIALETDPIAASVKISGLIEQLGEGVIDRQVFLSSDFSIKGSASKLFASSVYRELAYCLEHNIHHKALIKVGLLAHGKAHLISPDFGVAPATIRNRIQSPGSSVSLE